MGHADVDNQADLRAVIRAVEQVRRMRPGESVEAWHAATADQLEEARHLLGSFGEGKALSRIVALSTRRLEWTDLSQVGVVPTSKRPWQVLQGDLLEPRSWSDPQRRARVLKMLRKLSRNVTWLPDDGAAGAADVSITDFCEERGILAGTLRRRLRRHNETAHDDSPRIRPRAEDPHRGQLYDRADLGLLLTEEERARCP